MKNDDIEKELEKRLKSWKSGRDEREIDSDMLSRLSSWNPKKKLDLIDIEKEFAPSSSIAEKLMEELKKATKKK